MQLATFDIPIYEGDRINCVDLLDALTKDVLKTQGDSELPLENEALTKMKEKAVRVRTIQATFFLNNKIYLMSSTLQYNVPVFYYYFRYEQFTLQYCKL